MLAQVSQLCRAVCVMVMWRRRWSTSGENEIMQNFRLKFGAFVECVPFIVLPFIVSPSGRENVQHSLVCS